MSMAGNQGSWSNLQSLVCPDATKTMNPIQKQLLVLGAALVLAMGVYPPWVRFTHYVFPSRVIATETQTEVPAGYSWIWEPPRADSSDSYHPQSVKLDWSRLFVQWVIAASVVGAALLWFKDSDKKSLQDWWASFSRSGGKD